MDFRKSIEERLESLRAGHMYRQLKTLESPHATRATVEGHERVLLNSNDYLGLASHPRVVRAATEALETWGFGSPASRLISGNSRLHLELEEALARFKGEEDALIFPTGYMTNLGVITSLVEPGDLVLSDEENHASIVDACRLARGETRVYPHCDAQAAKEILASASGGRRAFVITDAVFSMDGDIAPLRELREAADSAGAWLVVDEAHATGVLGRTGRGIREHFGGSVPVEVSIGTLGKALAGTGGFVSGSRELIDLLRNRARTFFYTTAPLPAACAGVLEALSILEEEPGRVASLRDKTALARSRLGETGLEVREGGTPIIPVILGSSERTMKVAEALFERGFFVSGIRPPTVAEGTCRLRVVVNEGHEAADLAAFADALADSAREIP